MSESQTLSASRVVNRSERHRATQASRLLRVRAHNDSVVWMMFKEQRKLVVFEVNNTAVMVDDTVHIELQLIGSLNDRFEAGKVVMSMKGHASLGEVDKTVNFSDGYVVVENPWKGMRIGTYMMNHLVAWALGNYASYQPVGITLGLSQAGEDNKERRNSFYARFKFRFHWDDPKLREEGGLERNMAVSELETTDKWKERITEFSVEEGLKEIFGDAEKAQLDKVQAEQAKDNALAAAERERAKNAGRARGSFAAGLVIAVGAMIVLGIIIVRSGLLSNM